MIFNLKILRGDILTFIYEVAPSKVKESSITHAYFEYYDFKDILRSIHYLKERGYIEAKEVQSPLSPDKKDTFYTITADGMTVVEQTKKDDSVIITKED